jgi:ABC-type polysaccharide/polyol phosphate transport system ATPase subunit
MSAAIELEGVSKRYVKLDERKALLRSVMPFGGAARDELWALRGIDLAVEEGEIVGILGANGAGKTTMLRLLAGVTRPTRGRVSVRGRIAPLISLGVGFHQEMSGRENAVLNGMLLGLTQKQARERLDEIIAFAELEEFIDTPVKFYSSGMSMRLGFSVIMHTEPTVLLIDEILAVGDAGFHVKCFERLGALHAEGATIVMVSHSMHMLRQLCGRGIVMSQGQVAHDGDIEEAIAIHCATMSRFDDPDEHRTVVDVVERRLVGATDESHHAAYDAPLEVQLRLRFYREVSGCTLSFDIVGAMGVPVASHSRALGGERPFEAGEEVDAKVRFRARLGGGNYELVIRIHSSDGELLGISEGLILFVAGRPGSLGALDMRATVEVDGIDRTDRRASLLEA